jgi:hypothetical protein
MVQKVLGGAGHPVCPSLAATMVIIRKSNSTLWPTMQVDRVEAEANQRNTSDASIPR